MRRALLAAFIATGLFVQSAQAQERTLTTFVEDRVTARVDQDTSLNLVIRNRTERVLIVSVSIGVGGVGFSGQEPVFRLLPSQEPIILAPVPNDNNISMYYWRGMLEPYDGIDLSATVRTAQTEGVVNFVAIVHSLEDAQTYTTGMLLPVIDPAR